MGNHPDDKSSVRARLLHIRDSASPEARMAASAAACHRAAQWLQGSGCASLAAYAAFRSELDLSPLIEWAWRAGIDVLVPRASLPDRSMTLHRLASWEELKPGAYGILEPDPAVAPALPEGFLPDAVLVPGSGFDGKGGPARLRRRLLRPLPPQARACCPVGRERAASMDRHRVRVPDRRCRTDGAA
ncbi:hypothetical protein BN871_GR_00230 [Paenibacillus sp. P22]|nr:hypothetical protein BN871_GR_00230 [Paenibacillus sp. P22]